MLLHATETGQGPPICLLHGLFGRSQNLGALARRWSHTNRVISLDLRNHGQSPHAPVMSYDFMAADVLLTLGQMNALPCRLLGHSMGGKVAMTIALNVPKSVSGLTVADIAPLSYSHGNQDVAAALEQLQHATDLRRRVTPRFVTSIQDVSRNATRDYQRRLIDLVSFIDKIRAYKDAQMHLIDVGSRLELAKQQVNYVTNTPVFTN